MATLLLKHIKLLVTNDESLGDVSDAAVYCTHNQITWVGRSSDIPAQYTAADTVLELDNRIVIPGLVNTHHHMYQVLTRAIAPDSELFGWLKRLYPAWNEMTGQDVYYATKLACAELVLSGCTISSDHLYCYPNDVKLEDSIRAAAEVGLRFHPTRGAMSKGESKGGMPPDSCVEDEEAILADMRRCIESFHDASKHSMVRVGLAPCSPFSVTEQLMQRSAQLARQYPKVRLHTHLAENAEDIAFSQKEYGCRPGKYIERVGWDQDDCWFAHCVMLDDQEMAQFAAHGIGVAHCPCSNLRLASGVARVRELLDAGVHTGLGVDGSASNDAANMMCEARMALLLQRHKGNVKGLTTREALLLATKGGAAVLGRSDDLGVIAPGYSADVVAWRTDGMAFAGAQSDLLGALLLNAFSLGPVDTSIINGTLVVHHGRLLTADVGELAAQVNERSARLCAFVPKQRG